VWVIFDGLRPSSEASASPSIAAGLLHCGAQHDTTLVAMTATIESTSRQLQSPTNRTPGARGAIDLGQGLL
jgi:hypothetical protein